MLIKELKKIISNKWIIFLLFVLSIFNIFFCINSQSKELKQSNEKIEQQQEKINNYSEYIQSMQENLNKISSFKMFNEKNNYHKKSAEKVINAYDKVKNVKPEFGNYSVIDNITKLGFSDVVIFIIILQCVVVSINYDRRNGMMKLIKSCKKGRVSLIISKIGAIIVSDLAVVLLIYIPLFVAAINIIGCDKLNVPIQSVSGFYESAFNVSVIHYLIFYIVFKYIAAIAYSVILLVCVILFENIGILYTLIGIIMTLSILAKQFINWDYKLAVLKILSPVTLIDTTSLTYKYYNMNILEQSFNITGVAIVTICIYFIAFATMGIIFFSNNVDINIKLKKNNKALSPKFRVRTMTFMEYKKVLVINKGIFILIALAITQIYMMNNINTQMDETQKYYSEYMQKLEGTTNDSKDLYIKQEQERFDNIQKEYDENTKLYMNNQISYESFMIISSQYSWDILPKEAFDMVKNNNEYVKKLKREEKINGWLIDDIGIKYLIEPKKIYNEIIAWIFMISAIILIVVSCFAYESETGMKKLTDSMLYGTEKLNKKKWGVSIVITTLAFVIANVPFIFVIVNNFRLSGVLAPAKSMQMFSEIPINVNILTVLIGIYLLKYIVVLIAMIVIILISKLCNGQIKQMAISFMVLVIPLIVYQLYIG